MNKVSRSHLGFLFVCILSVIASGCGSVNDHMNSMDSNMTRMANEIQYDRTAISSLSEEAKAMTDYAKAMSDTLAAYQAQIKVIADSLAQLNTTASSMVTALLSQMKTLPPDPTPPNFGDFFGKSPSAPSGASAAPGATGATGAPGVTNPPTPKKDHHS